MFYFDDTNMFYEVFNPNTGEYIRSDILTKNELTGKMVMSGKDPFMRNFPGLIDVGIMGHCQNAEMGLCCAGGIDCYQSAKTIKEPHMSVEDFEKICSESTGKVFQMALGGRGDPNKHPHFKSFLLIAEKYKIVPNYTTSGIGLTTEEVDATKTHCGAVAVSWQRGPHTMTAIDKFLKAGCKTNIHYVLSKTTIDEAIGILKGNNFLPSGINAIIFLLHKPVGQGTREKMLDANRDNNKLLEFCSLVNSHNKPFKIGFDSCTVPLLVNNCMDGIEMASLDTCEGSRYSMYITPTMLAVPCSFDQDKRWAVDLKKNSIKMAWDSDKFNHFRAIMKGACKDCSKVDNCLGGCPIKDEIVLCKDKMKYCKEGRV